MDFPMNISGLKENLSKMETPYHLKDCLNTRLNIFAYARLMRPNKARTTVPGGHIARVIWLCACVR